jgi:hypothetical protein
LKQEEKDTPKLLYQTTQLGALGQVRTKLGVFFVNLARLQELGPLHVQLSLETIDLLLQLVSVELGGAKVLDFILEQSQAALILC